MFVTKSNSDHLLVCQSNTRVHGTYVCRSWNVCVSFTDHVCHQATADPTAASAFVVVSDETPSTNPPSPPHDDALEPSDGGQCSVEELRRRRLAHFASQ
eukprot:m.253470 g.253470  ORF g.253470 m.253470 type:complete len:99 (-) comp19584_c0_seq18:60-356(-)